MKIYTYSKTRQELAKLLEEARIDGEIGIKKRNGETFILRSVWEQKSPLDLEGIDAGVNLEAINEAVWESR